MTLQKWIEDRAIHGFPTFSVEDVRAADLCSSEQILQNELSRLSSNKTIASVYRGYYVIIPTQYVLRGSVPRICKSLTMYVCLVQQSYLALLINVPSNSLL